jgi:predicted enzyme involved in methoxymalonyl-ACP biosynthesis
VLNSSDKACSIRAIAAALNIGTDEIVFLDRSPAQRGLVREALPDVAVPEVTSDPADYPDILSTAGYFDAVRFSSRDGGAEPRRTGLESARFGVTATISSFHPASRNSITRFLAAHQNDAVGTVRSERGIDLLEEAADRFCLQISLADRRCDYGIVSIVIFERNSEAWHCELWIESAGSHWWAIETLALSTVALEASRAGASRLNVMGGHAGPTVERNFEKLGFSPVPKGSCGRPEWTLDLATYEPPPLPIEVIRPN